jgi:hypothetical protein
MPAKERKQNYTTPITCSLIFSTAHPRLTVRHCQAGFDDTNASLSKDYFAGEKCRMIAEAGAT